MPGEILTMNYALAMLVPERLMRLSSVDLAIIAIYFLAVLCIGFYLKRFAQSGEDFFLTGIGSGRFRRCCSWAS